MKSLKQILEPVKTALCSVTDQVYHYEALKAEDRYIVWSEDGGNPLSGDDMMIAQAIQGTIDYFTTMEYDPNVDAIQKALRDAKISFYLNSQIYDDVTKLMDYQWIFEVA